MNGILLPRNDIHFPLVKVIVSKIAYKSRWKTKNEHFLTTNYRKVVLEIFSGTSGISYCSKTCSSRPGLSIAPTPDRFGHVQAMKDITEKRWIPDAPEALLKKNAHLLTKLIVNKILWYFLIWGTPLELQLGMPGRSFETSITQYRDTFEIYYR